MSRSEVERNKAKIAHHWMNRQNVEHDLWQSRFLSLREDLMAAREKDELTAGGYTMDIFDAFYDKWFGEPELDDAA